ncbi:MAG: TonB-dependent receptor [Tannerellaceae bacterium]|jgi:TonB-linked SusC/RagA family outer membrane protein|nr:TonB-dependent receptor [Tannerellaceae bacterium]
MKKYRSQITVLLFTVFFFLTASLLSEVAAQGSITIHGTVTDASGEPLIGVNVVEKGTTNGQITDIDGKYTLSISGKNSILSFSYIGYMTQEMAVGNNTTMNVQLRDDSHNLEEVVVIGYGTQAKKDLTGSVGVVSQAKLENQASPGIGQNLQGKIAGVQIMQDNGTPYGGTSIRIRGNGSFGATSAPLIVVDGMITNDGLNNLNPNDVENITILKDAASAAIYGSRGANGVVIVTTKKGSFESPMKIDVSAYASVDNVRYKIPTLTAKDYAILVNDYYAAANLPVPFSDAEVGSFGKGTNWVDEITQSGNKQSYSVNITGGTKANAYAATANLYTGEGIIKNTTFKRGNIKLSNDMLILPTLKVGVNLNVNYGASHNTDWGQAIDRALIYPPTVPAYDENGDYGVSSHHGEPITMLQPLIAVDLWTYDQTWRKFIGIAYAEWEIVKGLTLKTSFNAENYIWDQDHFIPSYSYGPKGLISDHPVAQLYVDYNNRINYEWDNILTFSKRFNVDHNLTAMAGYTFQEYNRNSLWGYRTDFLNNDKSMQVLSAGASNIDNDEVKESWAILSYLGRVNYDYQNKYLLSASIRVDETSRIAKNNRTGVFPGASAGWVISQEEFMKDISLFSYLKLRASWGVLGNQDIGIYPYQTTLNSSDLNYVFGEGTDGTTLTGVGPTALGNSSLLWEKTSTVGVGLDSYFLDDHLTFMADFYKRNTTDILVRVPLLSTAGINTDRYPYQNAGAVTNTGIELSLGYSNARDNMPLTYDVSVNWTYNTNKVTKIPAPIVNNFDRVEVGHSINEWYGYVQDGIFQTKEEIANSATQPNAAPGDIKFKDLDENGVIDTNDRQFLGHSTAPHSFGGNIAMAYKKFDLVAAFYGQLGAYRNMDKVGFAITRGGEQTSEWMYKQRWTGPGTSNYIPRVVAGDPNDNYRRSDFWLRSTDFFRLQNLQIGYNFDKLLMGQSANVIKKLRFYIAAQNLFCINSYPGWDPEQNVNGGFPIPRSFYAGINVGF